MKRLFSGTIGTILLMAAVGLGIYFGNLELQSYLGRRAIASTGLEVHRLEDAIARAKNEHKLVFVDVSAIWCGTCRRLDNDVLSDERVKKVLNDKYIFSRIEYETEEGQKFVNERNVKGFPNLWVLDGEGRNVKRLRVLFDPDDFAEQLEAVRN